ncbi:MAG: PEP-CTERM sorting domain-containing protein [Dehalococcoidia bacterium]|nr:PEP-CTERM sorting domain-containing protein [Dehalococcoidia bacterium]
MRTSFLLAALALSVASAVGAAPVSYFCGVGDLPGGGTMSQANAVSADGLTVVGCSSSAASSVDESVEAFVWTASEGMRGLGDVPGWKFYSNALGVSAHGEVIVGRSLGPTGDEACYWTPQGQPVVLDHLPGQAEGSAYGVSTDGTTIVGTSGPYAFRWTQSEGTVALPDLVSVDPKTVALSASADGSVIVGHSRAYDPVTGYYTQAFRWTDEWCGGMVGLGDLPGGYVGSGAESISDDGRVIVGSSISANGGEAFRWTMSEGMVGLGDLPGGSFGSQAFDVSADGAVIVGRGTTSNGNEAFVWDAVHGMRNLQDVLVGEYGLDVTGWALYNAMSVSADGMTIVGIGRNPQGYEEGWVAHVPEPPSLLLLALGGMAVMRRRR